MDIYTLMDFIAYSQLVNNIVHFAYIFTFIATFVFAIYGIGSIGEWVWNDGIGNLIEEYNIERQNRTAKEVVDRTTKLMRTESMSLSCQLNLTK